MRWRHERGQTSAEYIGVLFVLVVVVAALVAAATPVGGALAGGIRTALCAIAQMGCDTAGTGGQDGGGQDGGGEEPDGPDPEVVADAQDAIDDLLDGGFPGVTSGDLDDLTDLLLGLDPDERNAVIAGMSDEQLAQWLREFTDSGWFPPWANLSDQQRRDALNELLPGLSEENIDRIFEASEDLRPEPDDPDFTYGPIEGAELYVDGVDPLDIDQGSLGDCHLLASLAAIAAQDPGFIQDMITDNGNGTYTVTFYEDGEPVQVTVDDHFPLDADGDSAYAEAAGDPPELWPLIIEKAWAEYEGSYDDIDGGVTQDTLESMTGDMTYTESGDLSFDDLAASYDAGDALAVRSFQPNDASAHPEYSGSFEDANGDEVPALVSAHAYFVTDVDADAGTVTVRNPHGDHTPDIVLTYDQFQDLFRGVAAGDLG